jgi:acyl-lipid omega-6 desaturase (Delta-12 desaturase)
MQRWGAVRHMDRSAARLDVPAPCASSGLSFDAIRAVIPARCYERSIGMGMLFLALTFIVYSALTYLLYTAQSIGALVAFAVIRGLTIGPTFIVGHDACHDALTPNARCNRVLGQIAFLPSWHSFTAWRLRHNFIHHRHTQILELDDAYPPVDAQQFQRMTFWQRLTYRLSRTIPFAGLLYFPEWLHQHLLPSAASREEYKKAGRFFALDYALIMLWMGCEVALFGGVFAHIGFVDASNFQPAVMLFFGLVVTQFFWNWQMGFVTFLHHFHPDVSWYQHADAPGAAERQLVSTVHMKFPVGLNWGMLNILEHTAHHIAPRIPLYQLANAQAALKNAYRSQVTQERISFSTVLKPFAVCKLWDTERKCWVGYPR